MKLAWLVPTPPSVSIEQFGALLLPHLTQLADVTVVNGLERARDLDSGQFDMLIYNVDRLDNMAATAPGIVILNNASELRYTHNGLSLPENSKLTALVSSSSKSVISPKTADEALQFCRTLLDFVEMARYHKPILDLTDFAMKLVDEMGADTLTAPPLLDVLRREIGVLASGTSSPSPGISQHGKPIITPPTGRWRATMGYYAEFPQVVQPYLVLNPKARAGQYSGGPNGLYGFIRNVLVRFKLQSLVERVIGPRLILTVRFFFSYPRVSDLYIVPPATVIKKPTL